MTDFVHKDILDVLLSIHHVDFFTVVTFMASFVYLLLGEFMFTSEIFYGYMCMSLSMAKCTYLWWPILYTYLFLVTYSVHKEVLTAYFVHNSSFWSDFYVPLLHDLVCTLGNFTVYFVYVFLRVELIFTFHGYMCTYFWWPIVYTYLLLVNQSVRMELSDGLFFTHTSQLWPKSY